MLLIALHYNGIIQMDQLYEVIGNVWATSSALSFLVCVFIICKSKFLLHINRRVVEVSAIGKLRTLLSIPRDFMEGMEVYPSILGVDLSHFVQVHMTLIGWQVSILCMAAKQYADLGHLSSSMFVSVLAQSMCICSLLGLGYMPAVLRSSVDTPIPGKRNIGFIRLWEFMCWMPMLGTVQQVYLVRNPLLLDPATAACILLLTSGSLYAHDCCRLHTYNQWNLWHQQLAGASALFFCSVPLLFHNEGLWMGLFALTLHSHLTAPGATARGTDGDAAAPTSAPAAAAVKV